MEVVGALLPGFDYIGSSSHDDLLLDLPEGTSRVRVSLTDPGPEILNLHEVALLAAGKPIDLATPGVTVAASSAYGQDDARYGALALVAGRGIHTELERNPWLEIAWPVRGVDQVRIRNRSDEYGRRSRSLAVEAFAAGAWSRVYLHPGADRLLSLLPRIAAVLGAQWLEASRGADWGAVRSAAAAALLASIERNPRRHLRDLGWVPALVNIYGPSDETDVGLLSAYFASVLRAGRPVGSLAIARAVLNSTPRIARAEELINGWLRRCGEKGDYIFTRHGIQRSLLRTRSKAYLRLTGELIQALEACGLEAFLSYGTLLGACRDGDFIPHDDDLDLVYVGRARSERGMRQERSRLLRKLRARGFEISEGLPLLNVHVSRGDDIVVDLFPSWTTGGRFHLYMHRMALSSIPVDGVLPLSRRSFKGRKFPMPADPDAFLTARYGPGWRVPDRFYEWPYALNTDGASDV